MGMSKNDTVKSEHATLSQVFWSIMIHVRKRLTFKVRITENLAWQSFCGVFCVLNFSSQSKNNPSQLKHWSIKVQSKRKTHRPVIASTFKVFWMLKNQIRRSQQTTVELGVIFILYIKHWTQFTRRIMQMICLRYWSISFCAGGVCTGKHTFSLETHLYGYCRDLRLVNTKCWPLHVTFWYFVLQYEEWYSLSWPWLVLFVCVKHEQICVALGSGLWD